MISAIHVGSDQLVAIAVLIVGLLAAGGLAARRGRVVAQQETIDNFKEAAESWEARYRAQQDRIEELSRKVNASEQECVQLRAKVAEMESRPDYDKLVETVQDLGSVLKAAVENEERLRVHAHNLANLGGAINLKLDAALRHMGIDIPATEPKGDA